MFFLLFGGVVMTDDVVEAWIGEEPARRRDLPNLTVELVQVSVFLAAFSGLYFTVSAVTDETYREQFFAASTGRWSVRSGDGRLPRAAGAEGY